MHAPFVKRGTKQNRKARKPGNDLHSPGGQSPAHSWAAGDGQVWERWTGAREQGNPGEENVHVAKIPYVSLLWTAGSYTMEKSSHSCFEIHLWRGQEKRTDDDGARNCSQQLGAVAGPKCTGRRELEKVGMLTFSLIRNQVSITDWQNRKRQMYIFFFNYMKMHSVWRDVMWCNYCQNKKKQSSKNRVSENSAFH